MNPSSPFSTSFGSVIKKKHEIKDELRFHQRFSKGNEEENLWNRMPVIKERKQEVMIQS